MYRAHHAMLDIDADVFAYERAIGERIESRAYPHSFTEARPMRNVHMAVKGNVLTITVKLDAKTETSKSGKSEIIASTEGNVLVPGTNARDEIKLGLNLYKSAK